MNTSPDPNAIRADIAKREQQLQDETDPDVREALQNKLAKLRAQLAGSAPPASNIVRGDAVQGDKIIRDKIENQAIYYVPGAQVALSEAEQRERYFAWVLAESNRTPLFLSGLSGGKLQLSAVYTALMTTGSDDREKPSDKHEPVRAERPTLSALAQLNKHQYCVLLGGPGSGKSTFVNFVSACMAGEGLGHANINLKLLRAPLPEEADEHDTEKKAKPQAWKHGALLPVQVVLRNFAATLPPHVTGCAQLLWDYMAKQLKDANMGDYAPLLKKHLSQQGGLILLDGLDEVPDAKQRRQQIKATVQDFAHSYGRCRFLVTSRTYAYQSQAWQLDGFETAVLTPFSLWQINRFVDAWYAHMPALAQLSEREAKARAETLKHTVRNKARVAELATRPLLLTLMARLQTEKGGTLPNKRQQLYERSVEMLLTDWEKLKEVTLPDGSKQQQEGLSVWMDADQDEIRKQLERVAFEAHRNQAEQRESADIEGDVIALALLKAARQSTGLSIAMLTSYLSQRAGILAEHGDGRYQFPHRTFQEYLAACYLIRENWPNTLSNLLKADPNRWREATLLAAAKAAAYSPEEVWKLVNALCFITPVPATVPGLPTAWGALLAAQALAENDLAAPNAEMPPQHEAKRKLVRDWLLALMRYNDFPALERAEAGRLLNKFGDPRPSVLEVDQIELLPIPAGEFWMGSQEDHDQFPDPLAYDDEGPMHRHTLPQPFCMSRYPITNAQYRQFVAAGGTAAVDYGEPYTLDNHPVVGVNWHQAVAFADWLTQRWHDTGKITANELVRLPSEAEWEKAARSHDARRYPWGASPNPNAANYADSGIGSSSAVGCFALGQSPYGCEDLSGNVWEWTSSLWRENYSENKIDDVKYRTLRGGAFPNIDYYVRCACRGGNVPGSGYSNDGFRVVVVSRPH